MIQIGKQNVSSIRGSTANHIPNAAFDGSGFSGDHQLSLVVEIPLFTRVLAYIPGGWEWDFFH